MTSNGNPIDRDWLFVDCWYVRCDGKQDNEVRDCNPLLLPTTLLRVLHNGLDAVAISHTHTHTQASSEYCMTRIISESKVYYKYSK
jgi:hypothetical protein